MDVSNRRKAPPSNVVAGSVWENRMKMDEVKGGIKVFKGEEETYQEDGVKPIQPNQLKRERRKTWKPEPIEIIGGTPIQVRKPRSDSHKLFSKSVDVIQKNPLFVDQSRSLFHENGKLDFDEDSFDDDEEETHFSANVKEEEKIDQIPIASNVKEEKRKTWKAEPFEIIGGNPIQVTKSRSDSHMFFDKSSDEIEKNPSYINKSGSLFDGRLDVDEDSWVYDDEEEEVIEKEIEEKSFYVKEAEKPIPISAIEKKLTPDVDILDQKPNKVVEEEKKLDEFYEKPMPISLEVDMQEEEKPKKNVKGQRRKSLKSELLEVIGANPVQVRKSRYDPHTVSSTKPVNELEKNPVIRKARSLFQRNRIFEVDLDVDDFDDESEEGVVEKEIERMEKSSDLKEVEKPISISANVSKLIPEYEGLEQKPKKIVKEDKRLDKVIEKPAPSVDFPEKKSKKVVKEVKKLVHMSTNVRKQPEIEMSEQKPEKVVKEDQVHEKLMSISANVNGQSLRSRSYVAADHNSFKPPPTVEECKRFPVAQNKLQSIVDLVMWNDVFKSALLFGFSTCILISSSYIENLNISLMSATCYLGLLFLAAISLYKLILSSFSSRRMRRGGRGGGWGGGNTAPSQDSRPTSSSSQQEADHHRDEISRARKEEDHKSNGTGASSMHNNLQHQQKGSDINISDINDFPVLSGGSSGKGKSHHIRSSKPQMSTSHDTKIGHDRSSQVAQYFSESVAKQENSPTYGASDLTLGSGGPTNARHLPNNSNNLQNLNQGASDQSNPQASFSTWSGSGDKFTNNRTPQPGGYSPERADTEFDHEKSQQVAQGFSPSMAKQENSPKFGAEDSSFSFGRPTNARHLPNISMSSNSPQNLNQVASHHSSLEASYSTWSGSGDRFSKSRTPQPGRTSPKRAECADDKPVVPPFDIRPVKTGPPQSKPSLLTKNKERREHEKKRNNNQILRSGMVLLKNYLTEAEQVKIVRECRELGLKPGGFYQPGYKDGAKLHLHMMCLGKEWDPETRLYQEQRSVDGAKPPLIPNVFSELVAKAIKSSHSLIKEYHKLSNPERELPCMEPDLCIVNFYSRTGKCGLHQDRDESSESLKNGLPVVSFSVGETAVFLYGDERDADKTNEVQLESGDVLIFGGKSRHVFHGVPSIVPNSAPGFLADDLRPGRLNLTFRKY